VLFNISHPPWNADPVGTPIDRDPPEVPVVLQVMKVMYKNLLEK
jgi:hypothetical protein